MARQKDSTTERVRSRLRGLGLEVHYQVGDVLRYRPDKPRARTRYYRVRRVVAPIERMPYIHVERVNRQGVTVRPRDRTVLTCSYLIDVGRVKRWVVHPRFEII